MTDFPCADLVRMVPFGKARAVPAGEEGVLFGYAAVFNEWATIDSWEGRFRERFLPGAFKKTISEQADKIPVLFNHGLDARIGDWPLGRPRKIVEDSQGVYVEVPLSDTGYNTDLRALLRDGALDGMSIRFSVVQERWDETADGMLERSIVEAKLHEFGPVTFPAYTATTAGVRSQAEYRTFQDQAAEATGRSAATAPDDQGAGSTDAISAGSTADGDTDVARGRVVLARRQLECKEVARWNRRP